MSQQIYGFLADGYTLEHCIPELKGFHPEVNVKFRPATPVERVTVGREIALLDRDNKVAEAERKGADFVAKHLVSWDLVSPPNVENGNPQPVEISVANILKLEHHLSGSLLSLTLGEIPVVEKQIEEDTKN